LRYTEDLASAAIAQMMEMSAEAVRVALHRIRAQLKKCISSKLAQES
jgi:DNA-directed RNA polymerase specialized sigma24 family protein